MPPTLTASAAQIISDEYHALCARLKLSPVALDLYVCDPESVSFTAIGTPVANFHALYGGAVGVPRTLALPLADGDREPERNEFPPDGWNKFQPHWPTWRTELWHEVVHQYSDQILGRCNPLEPGIRRADGTMRAQGHGAGWLAAVELVAAEFGVPQDTFDALVG